MSVLIVGAGPGLGSALAHRLGSAEQPVGVIARRPEPAEAIVDSLAGAGIRGQAALADVSDGPALRSAIDALAVELGPIETAVFNASVFVPGAPTEVDVDAFTSGLAAGVTSGLITLQSVAEQMKQRRSGTFMFTGGATALNPWVEASGLSVQKAGIRNLALSAAKELIEFDVHVCTITIMGAITAGTVFAPERIAETFAEVASRPKHLWEPEVRFTGESGT